jgi:hypothetical protein
MDYTGLNVVTAKDQIYSLYDQGKKLAWDYNEALQEFWFRLSKQWQAPNAERFQQNNSKKLYNIATSALIVLYEICTDAVIAYNSLASSLGAPTIEDDYFTVNKDKPFDQGEGTGIGLQPLGPNNQAVMDPDAVEETNNWFKGQFDVLVKGFRGLPMNIAFYDPDGAIVANYQTRITKAADEIEALSTAVYDIINAEISDYRQAVEKGKEEASQAFTARG